MCWHSGGGDREDLAELSSEERSVKLLSLSMTAVVSGYDFKQFLLISWYDGEKAYRWKKPLPA